jgi:tetratricopeptide (TPR) repeat protein
MPAESSQLGNSTFARAVISASGRRRQQAESRFAASGPGEAKPAAGREAPAVPKLPLPPLPSLPEATEDSGGYVRKVVALIRDAAQALQTVHDQGIIHRDISPGNLMLTPDGSRVVLMDFGLAKGQDLPSIARSLTEAGGFVGKLRYAAREQLSSSVLKVGPQADVHGLGVTLWELLTRKRLFSEAQDERQLATMILERDVPRLRQVDPGFDADLEAIVARATEGRASDRLESAGQMAEYLQLYLDGKPLPIRPPTLREIAYRWAREHKAVAATAAIVMATIIAALVAVTVEWKRATAAEISQRRAKEMAVQKTREAEAVTEFLQDMLASVDPASALGREVTVRMVLEEAAKKIGVSDRFRDQPLVEASIRATMGKTFEALGLYGAAEPHLLKAMEIRQRVLGKDHPDALKSMNDLALVWGEQGKCAEAVALYRQALAAEQRVLGKDHPDALKSMNDLGFVLCDGTKEYSEAEKLYRQALAARERVLGKDHPDTLTSMNGLANVLRAEGKYPEAEELYRQALAARQRVLGKDHPMTLRSMFNLGSVLFDQHKYAEAEELDRQTLAAMQRVLGKDHPLALRCMNYLAKALRGQGKYAEAEELHRQALAARVRIFGMDHQDTLSSMNSLANLLDDEGKYPEAEELHRQVLAASQRVLRKDHPDTLEAMNNLANGLRAEGKYPEAEELYRQALAARQRILGKDHPDTLMSMKNLADLLEAQGKKEEARQLREEREEILRGLQKPSTATGNPQ